MVLLDHDTFLSELSKLYEATKDKKSVWVSLKQVPKSQLDKGHKSKNGAGSASDTPGVGPEISKGSKKKKHQNQPQPSKQESEQNVAESKEPSNAHALCMVRATDGKKKISCIVKSTDHAQFHMELMTLLRASADALKKKQRPKKGKSSATMA